jgi:hypothetical protein
MSLVYQRVSTFFCNECSDTKRQCKSVEEASIKGHLDCLQRLHRQGSRWTPSTLTRTMYAGHLDCIEYLLDNGYPLDPHILNVAYISDIKEEIVRFLVTRGASFQLVGKFIGGQIASSGNFELLKFFVDNGCQVDDIINSAAQFGHINIVHYLVEKGANVGEICLRYCMSYKEFKTIKELIQTYHLVCPKDLFDTFDDESSTPNGSLINEVDFDDPFWKWMFYHQKLSHAPRFQRHVQMQINLDKQRKEEVKTLLTDRLLFDIVTYNVVPLLP